MTTIRRIVISLITLSVLVLSAPTISSFSSLPEIITITSNEGEHPRAAFLVGWISIAFWIVLWLSYVQQSGEGLSLVFLIIWLAGDVTNLLGAFWQNLLPTMVLLGAYYALCDVILISQIFYYRRKRSLFPELFLSSEPSTPTLSQQSQSHSHLPLPTESDPLLSSFSASGSPSHPFDSKTKKMRDYISYSVALILLIVVGTIAWKLSESHVGEGRREEVWDTKAQIVGWMSAFLYLGSRIPQIAKNAETKCQGLSLLMFCFSVMGNVTYVASILLQSLSADHLLINAAWLVGSGGTIGLDFIVLSQFWWYSKARKEELLASSQIFSRVNGNDEDDL